jgi:hypothetical protein
MVEDRKHRYVSSKRLEKPLIAFEIIKIWRTQDPPGRFLKKEKSTGLWNDVGDAQARKKTSQALREQAPLIRELGNGELGDMDDFDDLEFDVDGHGTGNDVEDDNDNNSPRNGSMGRKRAPVQVDVEVEHVLMDEECNVPVKAAATATTASSVGGASFLVPAESGGSARMEWRGYTSEQLMVAEGEVSTGRGLSFGVREHSLGDYPLEHATVTQTAIDAAFDKRSGAWATPPNYFAIAHSHSLTATMEAAAGEEQEDESPIPSATPSPSSAMRGSIDIEPPSLHAIRSPSLASDDTPVTSCSKDAMKRATSHQNETFETKRYLVGPSVKRVALSRGDTTDAAGAEAAHYVSDDTLDAAIADAALATAAAVAAASSPRVARQPFKDDLEMRELTQSMEKSSLVSMDELAPLPSFSQFDPPPMASRTAPAVGDRITTIDHITMDLMVHPVSLSRTNTEEIIRTLASDLDEGTVRRLLSGGGYELLDRNQSS